MKQIVKYTAIDPYYSDQTQTYIGATREEVLSIRRQTEEYMARNHSGLLSMIYKSEIVFDNTARRSGRTFNGFKKIKATDTACELYKEEESCQTTEQ